MSDEKEKRIYANVPQELYDRIEHKVPWGVRSEVWRQLLELTAAALEKDGPVMLHLILAGEVKLVPTDVHLMNTSGTEKS